jgi:hypothetical protein
MARLRGPNRGGCASVGRRAVQVTSEEGETGYQHLRGSGRARLWCGERTPLFSHSGITVVASMKVSFFVAFSKRVWLDNPTS